MSHLVTCPDILFCPTSVLSPVSIFMETRKGGCWEPTCRSVPDTHRARMGDSETKKDFERWKSGEEDEEDIMCFYTIEF